MNEQNDTDIIVITTAKAKPEKQQEVLRALLDVAKAARTQPGCLEYRILSLGEEAGTTANFERWSSEAERDTFLAGPDVQKFVVAVSGNFAAPPQPISYSEVVEI